MDRDLLLQMLLREESEGVVCGVLAMGHMEWTRQIKKAMLCLASQCYIELLDELEETEVGLKIHCRLKKKAYMRWEEFSKPDVRNTGR